MIDPALLALALVAGAAAAVNPCGFALLPAYLGLVVAADGQERRGAATVRAVRFAAGMSVGFVAVFGIFGAVVAPLALSIEPYLPIVTVVTGVVLVGLGGWLLSGHELRIAGLAGHGSPPTASWRSQIGYGVSFAFASLSCTVAPFLAVTASSLGTGGPVGVAAALLTYAGGMGIVVLTLALAVAFARTSLVRLLRRAGAWISRGSGALLVIAGGYVAWYGWFEIRVLAGSVSSDPVIGAAIAAQAAVTRGVIVVGPAGLLTVAAALAVGSAALLVRRRRARARREHVTVSRPQPSGTAAERRSAALWPWEVNP